MSKKNILIALFLLILSNNSYSESKVITEKVTLKKVWADLAKYDDLANLSYGEIQQYKLIFYIGVYNGIFASEQEDSEVIRDAKRECNEFFKEVRSDLNVFPDTSKAPIKKAKK